mmetsp:Transcript_38312/g.75967  ORF Transcript_38312/g.75967 Transcript_38312/m.75967 type:complete len:152 (+) Transcript_38312:493-948(+)
MDYASANTLEACTDEPAYTQDAITYASAKHPHTHGDAAAQGTKHRSIEPHGALAYARTDRAEHMVVETLCRCRQACGYGLQAVKEVGPNACAATAYARADGSKHIVVETLCGSRQACAGGRQTETEILPKACAATVCARTNGNKHMVEETL